MENGKHLTELLIITALALLLLGGCEQGPAYSKFLPPSFKQVRFDMSPVQIKQTRIFAASEGNEGELIENLGKDEATKLMEFFGIEKRKASGAKVTYFFEESKLVGLRFFLDPSDLTPEDNNQVTQVLTKRWGERNKKSGQWEEGDIGACGSWFQNERWPGLRVFKKGPGRGC
jgi:hypothetical protein